MSAVKLRIWRPKALAICWALMAVAAFGFIVVVADAPGSSVTYVPIARGPNPPTTDKAEEEMAKQAVLASSQAEDVLKGRNFTFEGPWPAIRHGEEIGTSLHIRLAAPAVLKTNWLFSRCLMTRQVEQTITWNSVQLIGATVDTKGTLIEFGPVPDPTAADGPGGPSAVESEAANAPTSIRDLVSGRVLWRSSPGHGLDSAKDFTRCPPGLLDD